MTEGPGSGVRILNRPAPQPFPESVKYAEANLCTRAAELVGDRNPREHEFSVQLRAFDASKTGRGLGIAVLLALCSALINKSLRGGLVVVGGLNLGGSIDPLYNAIDVVELAVEKGASVVLIPVSARKQLFDLSDNNGRFCFWCEEILVAKTLRRLGQLGDSTDGEALWKTWEGLRPHYQRAFGVRARIAAENQKNAQALPGGVAPIRTPAVNRLAGEPVA